MKTGWFQAYAEQDSYDKKYGLHWYYAGVDGKVLRNMYTPDGYWLIQRELGNRDRFKFKSGRNLTSF